MRDIVIIAHDMRSTHNVGSLLRTADGMGVSRVFLTGYTPYPLKTNDDRLPHIAAKIDRQIEKTALGASKTTTWSNENSLTDAVKLCRRDGYHIVALEQSDQSVTLHKFKPRQKIALLLGNEVDGLDPDLLSLADTIVEIPMLGKKESYNVIQSAAMALYRLRFY